MPFSDVEEQIEMWTFPPDKEGDQIDNGLDEDGTISRVEGDTPVPQGNAIGLVKHTEDTQEDESNTATHSFAFSKKTGSILFVIGCMLLSLFLSMIIKGSTYIKTCPDDVKMGGYMVVQGFLSMTILVAFAIRICCRNVQELASLRFLALIGFCIYVLLICGISWNIHSASKDSTVYKLVWVYNVLVWFILSIGAFLLFRKIIDLTEHQIETQNEII